MGILGLHVTTFDFIHIRSTKSLSRKVKRLARKLHAIMENLKSKSEEAHKFFEEGNEEKEFTAWKELLKIYQKEESIIGDMTFKEEQITHDEIKDENNDENVIKKLINHKGIDKDKLGYALKKLNQLHSFLDDSLNKERTEMRDMYENISSGFLKYSHLVGDKENYWDIKNLAVEERLDVINLSHAENNLKKIAHELLAKESVQDEDYNLFNKAVDEIYDLSKTEFSHILMLLRHIDYIQVKISHMIASLDQNLDELKKEGFSEKHLSALRTDLQKLKDYVKEERDKLFHGARYNEHSLEAA